MDRRDHTPNGTRRKVTGRNRTEARQRLDRLRRAIEAGEVAEGNATVADAVNVWAARVLAGRKLAPRTRERYECHCRVIIDELGSRRLAKLTADDIESMLDRQVVDGARSRDTLAKLRATLVQILEFAVRRGLAVRNPAAHATVPADAGREAARNR